jgi:hypothetical protein
MAFLVIEVPVGKDDEARWKSLRLAGFLSLFDIKLDIIGVCDPLFVLTQKFIRANCIVLDHGVKLVEELPFLRAIAPQH